MLWQLPFSLNKKEQILKTSLIFLNFIDPGLLQFIAKEMVTFRIGWTTLSLKFLDIVTFSLTSPPEKKNSEIQPMQHKDTYTLEKKNKLFFPKKLV